MNEWVGIDSDVMDSLTTQFSKDEIHTLLGTLEEFAESIIEKEKFRPDSERLVEAFEEMEKLIPVYAPMLRAVVTAFGSEIAIPNTEMSDTAESVAFSSKYTPKLYLQDGSTSYSMLQIAACKCGLNDANLYAWYRLLQLLFRTHLQDSERMQ